LRQINALKVGIWVVIAIAILVLGTRYFEGLSLRGTYTIYASFSRVDGMIAGNPVQINGVRIGNVNSIDIDPESHRVTVSMNISRDIEIPQGSRALQMGMAAISGVRVEIETGPSTNPPVPDGGFIEGAENEDILETLSGRAEPLVGSLESVLDNLNRTLASVNNQFEEPGSDVMTSVASFNSLMNSMQQLIDPENGRLSLLLTSMDQLAADLNRLAVTGADSLGELTEQLSANLENLDQTLTTVRALSANLTELTANINEGNGTLGQMAVNPSLYHNLDSTLVSMRLLLEDLRENPRRYLKELRIVDLL
jgi:phospholipid/cholesterol/gamma-HCH transport system substrate-binding protein